MCGRVPRDVKKLLIIRGEGYNIAILNSNYLLSGKAGLDLV